MKKKKKNKRRKPLTKKKLALIEYEGKELIEDLYDKVEKLIYREEIEKAESLAQPKTYFDELIKGALSYKDATAKKLF